VAVIAIGAAAGITAIASPAAAEASPAAPQVPVTATPLPALELGCRQGQTDFNTAPAAAIAAVLQEVDPTPQAAVAARVVADRKPLYLRIDDLLLVNGIGPGKTAALAATGHVCFGLPATPPPVNPKQVCVNGDARVDINRPASATRLADLLGRTTADRVVTSEPFPSLDFVRAERIGGAGAGRIEKVLDQLCYTPTTIRAGERQFGWITRAASRVDHPAGASLVVPAGVLDGSGAWGSVQPEAYDANLTGPKFDLHIYGSWADGHDRVLALLPPDSFVPPTPEHWTQSVLHDAPTGTEVLAGDALGVDHGRVVAALTSLSAVTTVVQPVSTFSFLAPVVVLPKSELTRQVLTAQITAPRSPDECDPDITHADESIFKVGSYPDMLTTGIRGVLRAVAATCGQGSFHDEAVHARITNTSGLVYTVDDRGEDAAELSHAGYTSDANIFMRAWMDARGNGDATRDSGFTHGPGSVIDAQVQLSSRSNEAYFHYDPLATTAVALLNRLDAIDWPAGEVAGFVNCLAHLSAHEVTFSSVVGCADSAASALPASSRLKLALKSVGRALNIYDVARDLEDSLGPIIGTLKDNGLTDATLSLTYQPTAKPTTDAQGRAIPPSCLRRTGAYWSFDTSCVDRYYAGQSGGGPNGSSAGPDGTIVVDGGPNILHSVGGQQRYISYDAQLAFGMPLLGDGTIDTDVYDCFAQRYVLRDWLPTSRVFSYHTTESMYPARCDTSIPELAPLPRNATNWILRESTGTAWLVDGSSQLHWIADRPTYICLAQEYFVRDDTPWSEISVFQSQVYAGDARCG